MQVGDSTKHLTLLEIKGKKGLFKCFCGNETWRYISDIIRQPFFSCGCLKSKGDSVKKHPLYNTWVGMRERCNNPNAYQYKHYGAKGVTICERWLNSFHDFVADMGDKPTPAHSIDRQDVNGPYSPENCFWRTQMEQASNRTDTLRLEYDGEYRTIREWSEITGVKIRTIKGRLSKGMTIKEALETPVKANNRKYIKDFSEEDVISIFRSTLTKKELAQIYNCHSLTISKIQHRELYSEMTKDL